LNKEAGFLRHQKVNLPEPVRFTTFEIKSLFYEIAQLVYYSVVG
jgi:hypothetical protein